MKLKRENKMNTHILDRFDKIFYDLNDVSINDVYIRNRDETEIEFNPLNFKNDKPKEKVFMSIFLNLLKIPNLKLIRFYLRLKRIFSTELRGRLFQIYFLTLPRLV